MASRRNPFPNLIFEDEDEGRGRGGFADRAPDEEDFPMARLIVALATLALIPSGNAVKLTVVIPLLVMMAPDTPSGRPKSLGKAMLSYVRLT